MKKKTLLQKTDTNTSAFLMLTPAVFMLIVTSIYPFFWLFRYVVRDRFIHWFSKKNQESIKKWMKKLTDWNLRKSNDYA